MTSTIVLPTANRPFVAALDQISETSGVWTVIGGLAVWCHLGGSHRPTLDIDTAATLSARESLITLGAPGNAEHRRLVKGVKLEVIEVFDPGAAAEGLEPKDRLFVTARWPAASDPQTVDVRCGALHATAPIARRGPLVACKLHAWLDRRDQRAEKRGSDGLDIVSLLNGANWDEMADELSAVRGLASAVAWAADAVLVEQATRVRRLIQVHTDAEPPDADHIQRLGAALVESTS